MPEPIRDLPQNPLMKVELNPFGRWQEHFRTDGFLLLKPQDVQAYLPELARIRPALQQIELNMRREDGTRCKETYYDSMSTVALPPTPWVKSILGSKLPEVVGNATGEALQVKQIMFNHYWSGHSLQKHTDGAYTDTRVAAIMNVGPSAEKALVLERPDGTSVTPDFQVGGMILIRHNVPHWVNQVAEERRTLVIDLKQLP